MADNYDINASVMRCLDGALKAMNTAVLMTVEHGPAKAMEYIADYLNETDAVDQDSADIIPSDWLTKWSAVLRDDLEKSLLPAWRMAADDHEGGPIDEEAHEAREARKRLKAVLEAE